MTLDWDELDHTKCFHSGPYAGAMAASTTDEDPDDAVKILMRSCDHLQNYRTKFTPKGSDDLLAIVKRCRQECNFNPLGTWGTYTSLP
jgi:hypothetical protein